MGIRTERVASLIQRELAPILSEAGKQLLDGGLLTLMEVEISPDLGLAKAYISIYNSDNKQKDLNTIEDYSPQIRKYLAAQLKNNLKKIPEIRFYLDETQDRAERMEDLLSKIRRTDKDTD